MDQGVSSAATAWTRPLVLGTMLIHMRAIIAVLDSFGVGSTPDAVRFGDAGSNTFGHVAEACAKAARGPLRIPNLLSLGLGLAAREVDPSLPEMTNGAATGRYGAAADTLTAENLSALYATQFTSIEQDGRRIFYQR